ncbi:DUF2510 domain-containing protein [Lacisediminihabitans changchengi]|uniref:DUF2510 domain-containing protein n=1 Tax=Lacisediminihabitans changchengi TaxID=2787634 RepID=UPI0027DEA284|nr:DUF2510 domain-containing protein [Lacisediminihabitans changchengi]
MFEDDVTVPAGWYPDPMGLPQLRWWNNHAWTELTTEARPPLVMQQPTQLLYADDELPTRRQQRKQREREAEYAHLATVAETENDTDDDTESADVRGPTSPDEPVTVTIREIESSFPLATEPTIEPDLEPTREPRSEPVVAATATSRADPTERALPATGVSPRVAVYTAPVWIIALLPLAQLVVGLLVLVGFGAFPNIYVSAGAIVLPYVAVVVLAIIDRSVLRRAGHEHPAHWAWAFLSSPVYLIARVVGLGRSGAFGVAPLLTWAALGLLQVASALVIPGMLISVIPSVFSAQAEQSIATDASVFGATLDVHCPTPPALLIGQTFTCRASSTAGHDLSVTVSLQRANGWIDWKVDDWGNTFVN